MKPIHLLVVFILASVCYSSSSNELQEFLSKVQRVVDSLSYDQIPAQFKQRSESSHWCCKVDPPIETIEMSRAKSILIQGAEQRRCGYYSCGFMGVNKCTKWCLYTFMQIEFIPEYYTVTKQGKCPDDQVACCNGHILILGQCFSWIEIMGNEQLLAIINEQGLTIPGVGK